MLGVMGILMRSFAGRCTYTRVFCQTVTRSRSHSTGEPLSPEYEDERNFYHSSTNVKPRE